MLLSANTAILSVIICVLLYPAEVLCQDDVVFRVGKPCDSVAIMPPLDTLALQPDSSRLWQENGTPRDMPWQYSVFGFYLAGCGAKLVDSVAVSCGIISFSDSAIILKIPGNGCAPGLTMRLFSKAKLVMEKKYVIQPAPQAKMFSPTECDEDSIQFRIDDSIMLTPNKVITRGQIRNIGTGIIVQGGTTLAQVGFTPVALLIGGQQQQCFSFISCRIIFSYRKGNKKVSVNEILERNTGVWRTLAAKPKGQVSVTFKIRFEQTRFSNRKMFGIRIKDKKIPAPPKKIFTKKITVLVD